MERAGKWRGVGFDKFNHSIERWIDLLDLLEMRLHQLFRRDLPGTDHFGHFSGTLRQHVLNLAVI